MVRPLLIGVLARDMMGYVCSCEYVCVDIHVKSTVYPYHWVDDYHLVKDLKFIQRTSGSETLTQSLYPSTGGVSFITRLPKYLKWKANNAVDGVASES